MSKVQYRNASGELLVGVLVDDDGLQDAVVLCHGYMDGKDRFHFPAIASALRDARVSTLRFDFAGNGESEGEFDFCAYEKEVHYCARGVCETHLTPLLTPRSKTSGPV